MSKRIYTADRETGTFIEECSSVQDVLARIAGYEEQDRSDGSYEEDFYDVVDENHCTLI